MSRYIAESANKLCKAGWLGKTAIHKKTGIVGEIKWSGRDYNETLCIGNQCIESEDAFIDPTPNELEEAVKLMKILDKINKKMKENWDFAEEHASSPPCLHVEYNNRWGLGMDLYLNNHRLWRTKVRLDKSTNKLKPLKTGNKLSEKIIRQLLASYISRIQSAIEASE